MKGFLPPGLSQHLLPVLRDEGAAIQEDDVKHSGEGAEAGPRHSSKKPGTVRDRKRAGKGKDKQMKTQISIEVEDYLQRCLLDRALGVLDAPKEAPFKRHVPVGEYIQETVRGASSEQPEILEFWKRAPKNPVTQVRKAKAHPPHKKVDVKRNPRWWQGYPPSRLCALSGFPIYMLPYPPFSLPVVDAADRIYFDGRFLVLHLISTFESSLCGVEITREFVDALDVHLHRRHLGTWRIKKIIDLLKSDKKEDQRALAKLRDQARQELKQLVAIQESRVQGLAARTEGQRLG